MQSVLNIGSLNLDYVYRVPRFPRPGETLEARHRAVHMGGKGLNQSIAMLRAGLAVRHGGAVGVDGEHLRDYLAQAGADVSSLRVLEGAATGHTFIQVSPEGENAILYYPGTNHAMTPAFADELFASCGPESFLVLQNEVNGTVDLLRKGVAAGLRVVFNPSPFADDLRKADLSGLFALILNETEAAEMTGGSITDTDALVEGAAERTGARIVLLTLGSDGLLWRLADGRTGRIPAFRVEAVDTTAAGDTFTGYAVSALIDFAKSGDVEALVTGLTKASAAAALSVTKEGAVPSIPKLSEVEAFLAKVAEA